MKKLLFILFLIPLSLFAQDIGGDYYISTTGSDANPGTYASPFATPQAFFEVAVAGDTCYIMGGTYSPTTAAVGGSVFLVDRYALAGGDSIGTSGTDSERICLFEYPGQEVVFDMASLDLAQNFVTVFSFISVEYWHLKGFEVKNLYQYADRHRSVQGFSTQGCANFTLEELTFDSIAGRGIWLTGFIGDFGRMQDSSAQSFYDCALNACIDTVYSFDTCYHEVLRCDFFDLIDSLSTNPYNYADGLKGDFDTMSYVDIRQSRFFRCSDDGLDLSGPGVKIVDSCWAFYNGVNVPAEDQAGVDDGNGFKLGGNRDSLDNARDANNWFLRNSISAGNLRYGLHELDYAPYYRNNGRAVNNMFYDNGQYGPTGFYNAGRNYRNTWYYNNISYANDIQNVFIYYHYYPDSTNSWYVSAGDPWFTDRGIVSSADFISLDISLLETARNSNGTLPDMNFGKLSPTSDLIDYGTVISADDNGGVTMPYNGSKPDLGPFEYNAAAPPTIRYSIQGAGKTYRHNGNTVIIRQ